MKRKAISIMLCIVCLLMIFTFPRARAAQYTEETIVLEGGSYMVVTTQIVDARGVATRSATRNYTFYGSDDVAQWKVSLFGRFQYNDSTSECLDASCTVNIYDNSWSYDSKSATFSGNTAYATAEMKYKTLGITIKRETVNLSLSCDANGNIY